jgi:hypothetical protein
LITPDVLWRAIKNYRQAAPQNDWPLWVIPLFWISVIGAFAIVILHFYFLRHLA